MPPSPESMALTIMRAIAANSPLLGRAAHAQILKTLSPPIPSFLSTHLINMYSKLDLPSPALRLLSLLPSPSIVPFTALISGAAQNRRPLLALRLLPLLLRLSLRPNHFTLPSLLQASSSLPSPLPGLQLHALSLKSALLSDSFVVSAAVHMYRRTRLFAHARQLFDEMPQRTVVAWNALMTDAVLEGSPEDAVAGFVGIRMAGEEPNEVSFCAVFNACALGEWLWVGSQVHSFVVRFGFGANVSVGNAMVDFYGKCGEVGEARRVFEGMEGRNGVSWCSVVAVLARNSEEEEAFRVFLAMRKEGFLPTDFVLSSVLTTCSGLSGVELGSVIYCGEKCSRLFWSFRPVF